MTTQVAPANFIKTTIYIQENVVDYLAINSKRSKEKRQCFYMRVNEKSSFLVNISSLLTENIDNNRTTTKLEPLSVVCVHLLLVYLVTAFVPSLTACFASSPGRSSRTAVCISREEIVDFLL